MDEEKETMRKILASIPDELAEWLDEYVRRKFEGIRGGKSIAVRDALQLLREKDER